jgi:RNA polymerase sigma-70 factor (ECF subfamily)
VTVNVVLSRLRKKGLLEVSLQEPLGPEERDGPKRDFGIRDNVLAGAIDRINLERAIENLPSGCRNVFVLFDIEGYGHDEIAGVMGCSIGNTKAQLHKARMKLRLNLKTRKTEMISRVSPSHIQLGQV